MTIKAPTIAQFGWKYKKNSENKLFKGFGECRRANFRIF
jgi:hypothetical protein